MTQPSKPTPRNIRRTWKVTLYGRYEGGSARVRLGSHLVTLAADERGEITAEVDGRPASEQEACRLLNDAKAGGTVELLSEERVPTISRAEARELHAEMGRLGFRGAAHYHLASEALEATVTSLASLTPEEAAIVRSYAHAQVGRAA